MKKSKIFAIANLVMTLALVAVLIFAYFHEKAAIELYEEKLREQEGNVVVLHGLGLALALIFAGIVYAISAGLLIISWIGLFTSDKAGFLFVGAIGKCISLAGVYFLWIGSISILSKVVYILIALLYLGGGIVDIVFREKIKA